MEVIRSDSEREVGLEQTGRVGILPAEIVVCVTIGKSHRFSKSVPLRTTEGGKKM